MTLPNSHLQAMYLDKLEMEKDFNELTLRAMNQVLSLQFEAARQMLMLGRRQWPDMLSSREFPLLMESWRTAAADSYALSTQLTRDMLDATVEIQRQFARMLEDRIPKLTADLWSEAEEVAKSFSVQAGVVPFKKAQQTTPKTGQKAA